jgi:flagellar protein FlbD
VILVHRLQGDALFLNADLIETVEAAPDTCVTLVDGRRILLRETPREVVELVASFRASIIVATEELRAAPRPVLRALPGIEG